MNVNVLSLWVSNNIIHTKEHSFLGRLLALLVVEFYHF